MGSDRASGWLGRFELVLALRLAIAFACIAAAAALAGGTELRIVPVLLVGAAVLQGAELIWLVRRSSARIAAALAAWRSGDLADLGGAGLAGTAFAGLGDALDEVTRRLREGRATAEEQRLYLEALVGHAPAPLLVLDGRRIELANHAARRLFGAAVGSLDELAAFGGALVRDAAEIAPGERRVTRMVVDGVARRLLISAGAFRARGAERRLIAIESIESELEARTLEAWVDMARVLAHEIMSSLTPVASLTATAAQLLDEPPEPATLAAAREATATAARRSEGLMTFVRRYRELAALPEPEPALLDLVEVVRGIAALLAGELRADGTELVVDTAPSTLPLRGDRALLEQALINLLRNAAEAVRGRAEARVWLILRITVQGRAALEVADTGPGVPASMVDKIFVPFFSTKARGGSGIGLAVARHVAHAHGGTLQLGERTGGGARFTLTL